MSANKDMMIMLIVFMSNVRLLGISAVGEVDVHSKMMFTNSYKLKTK